MSLERTNHMNRISNWFQQKMVDKYVKGQQEHKGNIWEKTGMLSHAIEEVIDLAVYLETMEEQLKERFPAAYQFFVGSEKVDRLYDRKMPRIYVAGRVRDTPGKFSGNVWELEQNIRCAENASLSIWRAGGAAFCPHTNTRFFQNAIPDENLLNGYLEWVAVSDAVYMVPGWETSEGSKTEKAFAERLNIPTFTNFSDLEAFIQAFKE